MARDEDSDFGEDEEEYEDSEVRKMPCCRGTVEKARDTEAEDPSGCPAILPSSCGAVRAQMSSHHDEAAVPKVLVSAEASAQQARALPTGGGSVTQAHDNLLLAVLSLQGISDEDDEEEDVGRHRKKEKEKKVKEKAKETGKKKKRAGGFIDDAAEEVRCRACQAWTFLACRSPCQRLAQRVRRFTSGLRA